MPLSRAFEWPNDPRRGWFQPDDGGCLRASRLLVRIPGALPGDQGSTDLKQRGRVLHQHRKRRERASRDDVVTAGTVGGTPLLDADRVCGGVRDLRGAGKSRDDLALASRGLDEIDLGLGERGRQGKPREPSPGTDVADPRRLSERRDFKAREAVGDVNLDRLGRRDDRRRR